MQSTHDDLTILSAEEPDSVIDRNEVCGSEPNRPDTATSRPEGPEYKTEKRTGVYTRTSTSDQHPETQLRDLQQLAAQRRLKIAKVYTDQVSGARARRPGLDQLLADARRGELDVVLVWSCDRLARSVPHFLDVLDELDHLNIEFISFREQLDTEGPLGRAVVVIIGVVAELERSLTIERVKAGLRRARAEGRRVGRPRLSIDRDALLADRARGRSLTQLAKTYRISRASVSRLIHSANLTQSSTDPGQTKPPQTAS